MTRYILSRRPSWLQETKMVNKQRQQRLWTVFWEWNLAVLVFYVMGVVRDCIRNRPLFDLENTLFAIGGGTFASAFAIGLHWWNRRKDTP